MLCDVSISAHGERDWGKDTSARSWKATCVSVSSSCSGLAHARAGADTCPQVLLDKNTKRERTFPKDAEENAPVPPHPSDLYDNMLFKPDDF